MYIKFLDTLIANGMNRTRTFCKMWIFWGPNLKNVVSGLQQDRHTCKNKMVERSRNYCCRRMRNIYYIF